MIILTALSEIVISVLLRIKQNSQFLSRKILLNIGFIVSCLIIILMPIFAIITKNDLICIWWNPINFIPYIFSSMIIIDESSQDLNISSSSQISSKIKSRIILFTFLWLISTILEWSFLNQPEIFAGPLPQYSRISSIFASCLLIYLSLVINIKNLPPLIQLLSYNSSGIYFTHRYFINKYFIVTLHKFFILEYFNLDLTNVVMFVIALVGSFTISSFLKRIPFLRSFI